MFEKNEKLSENIPRYERKKTRKKYKKTRYISAGTANIDVAVYIEDSLIPKNQ
jgi:hypothetical protein